MNSLAKQRRTAHLLASLAVAAFVASANAAPSHDKPKGAGSSTSDKATAAGPAAKTAKPSVATPQRQQELQRQQRDLQVELAKLKRRLAARESSHSETTDALASADIAISQVNRRLHELAVARERLEQQLAALVARERDAASRQTEEERQLERLLLEQHRGSLRDPMQVLLQGGDPNAPGREDIYLGYLARDAEATVSKLQARRQELSSLHVQTEEKRGEIERLAEDEARSRQLLEKEQARRKRALQQLTKEIATQRQSIARLERDEQRLGVLVDQISRILAEQARKDAERARQRAEREATARRSAGISRPPGGPREEPSSPPTPAFQPPTSGNFGQLKGKLPLPVQGSVAARFGSPRRGDGAGGLTWKGLFLKAPEGAPVRSVADGRIVFADWLRGFGNLLVIDHGDGYLSIYGNNASLLRNVGDRVAVGDLVASVGDTGGSETPGLYFELRFQGRPFDPLGWVAAR